MSLKDRIDECLEHFSYVIVKKADNSYDNVVNVPMEYPAPPASLYRFLKVIYGDRAIKYKGGVRINEAA